MPKYDGTGPCGWGMQRCMRGGCCRPLRCMRPCEGFVQQGCYAPCLQGCLTKEEVLEMLEEYKKRLESQIALLKKECEGKNG